MAGLPIVSMRAERATTIEDSLHQSPFALEVLGYIILGGGKDLLDRNIDTKVSSCT